MPSVRAIIGHEHTVRRDHLRRRPGGGLRRVRSGFGGLKTLILEKRKLPRYKTCAGGVPLSVENDLPKLVPEAFVEATVTHLRHSWNFRDAHLAR